MRGAGATWAEEGGDGGWRFGEMLGGGSEDAVVVDGGNVGV